MIIASFNHDASGGSAPRIIKYDAAPIALATVEELIARRDSLRAIQANGLLSVRHADGRMVTYKSNAEIDAAIAAIDREISDLAAAPGRPRRYSMAGYRPG